MERFAKPHFKPHQLNVVLKHNELHQEYQKLKEFIDSSNFTTMVDEVEQKLLIRQLAAQRGLLKILGERINLYGD